VNRFIPVAEILIERDRIENIPEKAYPLLGPRVATTFSSMRAKMVESSFGIKRYLKRSKN
jgi:hypothetical protein